MLYVVQHAEATSKEEDPERPLNERGLEDARRLAAFLEARGVTVDRVYDSGKARARETAEILAGRIAPGREVEDMAGLEATDPVEPIEARIGNRDGDTLIVSHQPFVGRLVASLVRGLQNEPPVAFTPGTVVALDRGDGIGWQVAWMIRPPLLE